MSKKIIPGFHLTLGITITMLSLLILIPLASVLVYSLRIGPAKFVEVISSEAVVAAFGTSILFAFIAALINTVFGVILAWVLVRYDFFGKRFLLSIITSVHNFSIVFSTFLVKMHHKGLPSAFRRASLHRKHRGSLRFQPGPPDF